MKKYNLINNITGWAAFLVAAIVYLLTIEPTASFWDCGEFIASAYKLEVGHPPGSPIFMLIGRFFTMFAGDVSKVAITVNIMSALASAFTILFLFWTITHLAKKLVVKKDVDASTAELIGIMGSGFIGALAYTFSDSFWFSAVEGEVYALSSFFTAIVFWAILKWENEAEKPYANRWLIFIAYMMGLSIGVHLLNLLTIPAIVFIYYFKNYTPTKKGLILASISAITILGLVMYFIIPGTVVFASWFELLFVNGFGLPFNSGLVFFVILISGLLAWGIKYTITHKKVLANTIILAITVILIGYSSYALIIIRSSTNTPLNENSPSNIFALKSYLNREQYGDRPLVKGQYYNAPVASSKNETTFTPKNGKYVRTYLKTSYQFDERFQTIFPRMWSPGEGHEEEYKKWANIKGSPERITNQNGEQEIRYVPTFTENLRFFVSYQLGFMYWRYFMWNFVGRQDDVQSSGGLMNGNWISGIKPIDAMHLGNQDHLTPEQLNAIGRNRYFFLPFILGLLGLGYQFMRDKRNLIVVSLLFVLTGIAIVVYLNQYPLQPRERDYAFAGSFYAFAIWVGLGVLAVSEGLKKILNPAGRNTLAAFACLGVPIIMGSQNWNDHDRSGRYTARDYAYNYLNSCAPNAILFTNGDNDTFPLWYAQEVEGIRTDVRVCNLSLLGTDWYVDQMKMKAYDSEPLPISMNKEQYVQGTRDIVYIIDRFNQAIELKQVIDFVASDKPETKYKVPDEEPVAYMPTKSYKLTIDKNAVISSNTVGNANSSEIVDEMQWSIKKTYIQKNDMIILDIIANNNWKRPIYFVSPYGDSDLGLSEYFQLEGFTYRLVPIKTKSKGYLGVGRINVDILYNNLMNKFRWGRMDQPDVNIDHNNQRTTSVLRLRNNFNRLAEELIAQNKKDSATAVLNKIYSLMPQNKYPYDVFTIGTIELYYKLNETDNANKIVKDYLKATIENLKYLFSLSKDFENSVDYEKQVNLQTLQQLGSLAETYGQTELKNEIDKSLQQYMEIYYQGRPEK
ncbi:MAG: DUF2723 domain-containing protein [Bacteroidales bacterium]|nr:MAG: DUF2723 domain-containing protein [Bacteroidales bacterium]